MLANGQERNAMLKEYHDQEDDSSEDELYRKDYSVQSS